MTMYLDEREKYYKRNIDERIERGGKLSVEYVIDNGNRCNIRTTEGEVVLMGLTLEHAYWVVNGILNYERR